MKVFKRITEILYVPAISLVMFAGCQGEDDIVAFSAGDTHTIALKKGGTVVAVGDNEYGQCDVSEWTDINK